MSTRQDDNLLTLVAVGVVAACVTTVAHEAIGHGGACLMSGGRISQLTSVYFTCTTPSWWIAIAGPVSNFVWALTAWFALQRARGPLRLLLALSMAFSLFWEAGYLFYSAILQEGDYFLAARDAFGGVTAPVRVLGAALGVLIYIVGLRMARAALTPFASERGRVRRIVVVAWVSAVVATTAAAALYAPDRLTAMRQAFLELGAASLPLLLLGRSLSPGANAPPLRLDWRWLTLAALCYAAFAGVLGRGLSF